MTCAAVIPSPVGPLGLEAVGDALTRIVFHATGEVTGALPQGILADTQQQLDEYFAGERRSFALTIAPAGTPFQQAVWNALLDIRYGETISYGELSRRLGKPAAVRAVGAANGQNPIPIVIPCHRVIGSDGRLVGFGGGLDVKRRLLGLEAGALF